jgi:hypothetical protein
MIDSTPCPDAATLFRLRVGKIPDPLATKLREHVATCPRCTRGPSGVSPGVHRLKPVHGGGASAAAVASAPRPVPGETDSGSVLRPPERPGELGRLAGYKVLRLLGQDGSGCIYEAEHLHEGVRVALQVVPTRASGAERVRQRMLQGSDEAFEVGEDNDALFLATALPAARPAAEPAPEVRRGPRYCPRCLADLREVGDKAWCVKCGYSSDEAAEPTRTAGSGGVIVPPWLFLFLAGCVAVVAATCLRRDFLPAGSAAQTWWILIEAGAGLLAYLLGHVLVVVLTFRHWRDGELFKYIDPMTAARYAFEYLPRTRYAICLAAWGAIAFLCAFVLFWMNDFAFKDKKVKKTVIVHGVLTTGEGETIPEEPEEGDLVLYGDSVLVQPVEDDRDVNVIDAYGDPDPPERQESPHAATCVVIGYVPDPNDPSRVSQLVLGTRDADGTIRYAGTVGNFARTNDVDQGMTQVKGLRPLLEKPGYLPAELNVIPVEPSMTARVGYQERDAQGQMKNATVKGLGKPAATMP